MIDHDRIAEVYEGAVGSREFQQVSRRRIHWMCAQVAGADVLDIGCSQGIASILLGREGHRVVGIDREHEAIRAARERLDQEEPAVRDRVEFRIGEGRAVGFPGASFDAVLLGEILEHQLDPGRLLDEARRVLRPGGRIVVTTPYGIHPYPDHMEPLYLGALLERLSSKLSIAEIALVDRYVGVVAEDVEDRAPRVWRRALHVAEGRLADQDEAVESLRALVAELREGARALERSLQEEDLTKKATEIQRDAAAQRQRELQEQLAEVENRAAAAAAQRDSALRDLEETRERLGAAVRERTAATDRAHALEAEGKAAAREVERLHDEVRRARERLQGIELGHRVVLADLERAQAEKEEADAAAREAQSRAGQLADLQRQLQHERTRASALESTRDQALRRAADIEERLRTRDAELAEAVGATERVEAQRAAAAARLESLEAQVAASRTRSAEARTRMADLIAERDAALDVAGAANRRADGTEADLVRLREQAAEDARNAAERAETLAGEVERARTTMEALTSEGAALRETLREAEAELEQERTLRKDLQASLEVATLRSGELEQELDAIQARLGYRMGRRFRRLGRPFRRGSREAEDGDPASLPAGDDEPKPGSSAKS